MVVVGFFLSFANHRNEGHYLALVNSVQADQPNRCCLCLRRLLYSLYKHKHLSMVRNVVHVAASDEMCKSENAVCPLVTPSPFVLLQRGKNLAASACAH